MKENVNVKVDFNWFWSLLQIVFIVLKLCKIIAWSWWLVLLPTIIGGGIAVISLIILLVIGIKKYK